jgi:hypothetical protein
MGVREAGSDLRHGRPGHVRDLLVGHSGALQDDERIRGAQLPVRLSGSGGGLLEPPTRGLWIRRRSLGRPRPTSL